MTERGRHLLASGFLAKGLQDAVRELEMSDEMTAAPTTEIKMCSFREEKKKKLAIMENKSNILKF